MASTELVKFWSGTLNVNDSNNSGTLDKGELEFVPHYTPRSGSKKASWTSEDWTNQSLKQLGFEFKIEDFFGQNIEIAKTSLAQLVEGAKQAQNEKIDAQVQRAECRRFSNRSSYGRCIANSLNFPKSE